MTPGCLNEHTKEKKQKKKKRNEAVERIQGRHNKRQWRWGRRDIYEVESALSLLDEAETEGNNEGSLPTSWLGKLGG